MHDEHRRLQNGLTLVNQYDKRSITSKIPYKPLKRILNSFKSMRIKAFFSRPIKCINSLNYSLQQIDRMNKKRKQTNKRFRWFVRKIWNGNDGFSSSLPHCRHNVSPANIRFQAYMRINLTNRTKSQLKIRRISNVMFYLRMKKRKIQMLKRLYCLKHLYK